MIGELPSSAVDTVSASDFDLHQIKLIILRLNGEIIASIKPRLIKQGTRQPERQYAAWELAYLDTTPIYNLLSKENADLVIDRITPASPTDRRIMLNLDRQFIHIGGFDHTLVIYRPEESPDQHLWIYYSGAGEVCNGKAAFVIRE